MIVMPSLVAQKGIQTEGQQNVENLIKDVFIKGNCRNVTNIQSLGSDSLSIGSFANASDIFNFEDGIIISTGDIRLAEGPNIRIDGSYEFNQVSNDPDLSRLATDSLFDVTGIEFDFVPIDNRVTFSDVFASEEYCEFVGTDFNDVFGFFVRGPGINGPFEDGAINVATIPGSNENVSINNVNHLINQNFFVSNATTTDSENCDINFLPEFQDLIEYDGFTVRLTASFQVIPCETYHIRLVVGDVGDARLDSAVFLESKSFDLGEKVIVRAEVPGRDEPIAYEDCIDGQIVFTRSDLSGINEDCTVEYIISPDGGAINGVDYVEIPTSVTIPAGVIEYVLPITILSDSIDEISESIKLEFEYACACLDPVFSELIIREPLAFDVGLEDVNACVGQSFDLVPEVIDGISPFSYEWSNGSNLDFIELNISQPTEVLVTVTDFCGVSSVAVSNIEIQSIPSAIIEGNWDLCETALTGVPIVLNGFPPWSLTYSINGEEQPLVSDVITSPFLLQTDIPGSYEIVTFNDAFCVGTGSGSAQIDYLSFDVDVEIEDPSCSFRSDGSITITSLEAVAPFDVVWNVPVSDNLNLDNLSTGSYNLSVTDANGCEYKDTFNLAASSLDVEDCAPVYIPNVFTPDGDGFNDEISIYAGPSSDVLEIKSFTIYNRWGELIYEQINFIPDNGITNWDGTYNSELLDSGVFTYKVCVLLNDGKEINLSGGITLIR